MTEHEWCSFQREHGYTILTKTSTAYGGIQIWEVYRYIVEEGWDEPDDPKPDGTLFFPDSVDGVPFTEIRENAFSDAPVADLRLPEGIRRIGASAVDKSYCRVCKIPARLEIIEDYGFCGATFIEDTFPEHVEMIGYGAFMNCMGLRNIHFHEGLQLIEDSAFSNCGDLKTVSLPASLISIGEGVFGRCQNLRSIQLNPNNTELSLINGALIRNSDQTMIAWFPTDMSDVCRIPDGVKRIGDDLFWGRTDIREVYLPKGVKHIGCFAFKECKLLEQISLPDSLESIDPGAFSECNKLKRIKTSNQSLADEILSDACGAWSSDFYWRKEREEQ